MERGERRSALFKPRKVQETRILAPNPAAKAARETGLAWRCLQKNFHIERLCSRIIR